MCAHFESHLKSPTKSYMNISAHQYISLYNTRIPIVKVHHLYLCLCVDVYQKRGRTSERKTKSRSYDFTTASNPAQMYAINMYLVSTEGDYW